MALVDTLNSMTESFFTSKVIADHVSLGHPLLTALLKRAKPGGGVNLIFDIEYNFQQGGWRSLTGQMSASSPEIVTQGQLNWRDCYIWAQMEKAYVYQNRHDPRKLADYMNTRVMNAVKSLKQRYLAPGCVTAQAGNAWDSLVDAINDSTPYANIANTGAGSLTSWRSLIGEATYDSPAVPVSPSLDNLRKMVRLESEITGEKTDLIVVDGAYYDVLAAQVTVNDEISAKRMGDNVMWGFASFGVDGVPIVSDYLFSQTVAAFDNTKATRALCKGSQALGINWDYFDLMYLPEWFMKWDEEGWRTPLDYTQLINQIHCGSNIVCRSRRHQWRLFGVDPTQSAAAFTLIPDARINTSSFAIPAEV